MEIDVCNKVTSNEVTKIWIYCLASGRKRLCISKAHSLDSLS